MRYSFLTACAAAIALSGCVVAVPTAPQPQPQPPVVVTPLPSATKTVDAGSARQVVSAELSRRYPGRNVGPMADCIIANASMAEQADLLAMKGTAGASNAMAAIVKKPATAQCIAKSVA